MPALTRGMAMTREAFAEVVASGAALPDSVLRKQFVAEIKQTVGEPESRTRQFCISTNAVDRDNDTINQNGWQLDNYKNNPVVLWAHDYNSLPVARCVDIKIEGGRLIATAEFATHPMAETVLNLIDGGFMRATSVGFRPTKASRNEERDGGLDFQEQELLEFSIVPVPANPEALIIASKGLDLDPLLSWAKTTVKMLEPTAKVAGGKTKVIANGKEGPQDICPACGLPYDGNECSGCGWSSPDVDDPMTFPVQSSAAALVVKQKAELFRQLGRANIAKILAQPKQAVGGFSVAGKIDDEDPLRWNRQLSKTFDVAGEPMEASRVEYAWASRFLEVPVQQISESCTFVPSARMGSFLSALEETLGGWKIEATRNLNDSSRETPPVYETLQLSSTKTRKFLVEGIRFMSRDDGAKIVGKMSPSWGGVYLTTYARREQSDLADTFVNQTWERSGQLNFLKGEAFTLSGEFLDRGELTWDDIFLEPKHERVLRRAQERINEQGEDMESRGVMIMGPPGTGKTLGMRVMMHETAEPVTPESATFIWVSARDFFRSGAYGAFTYAFDIAAECAPTILCFEDVDSYLYSETIDLLKTEMDGMKRRKGILTVMTTNFPELVPDALIDRPGRFDELLEIDLPTEEVRSRMLRAWLPEVTEAAVAEAAVATAGYSGAHINELAKYTRTVAAEEKAGFDSALTRAIDKIKEQRELVASLRQAPDYRPGRSTRAAVATTKSFLAKRGRVLSQTNEGKLRAAQENLEGVLAQLETQPELESDDKTADDAVIVFTDAEPRPGDVIALHLVADNDAPVSSDDILVSIKRAIESATRGLGPMVADMTQSALARAYGRVD